MRPSQATDTAAVCRYLAGMVQANAELAALRVKLDADTHLHPAIFAASSSSSSQAPARTPCTSLLPPPSSNSAETDAHPGGGSVPGSLPMLVAAMQALPHAHELAIDVSTVAQQSGMEVADKVRSQLRAAELSRSAVEEARAHDFEQWQGEVLVLEESLRQARTARSAPATLASSF